ncbi:MAG: flagellar hook-length control protein FliK [Hahellaceae bacterium]|nr:flagellar hook-length control protein FliK [Hahellaceae bacterium]
MNKLALGLDISTHSGKLSEKIKVTSDIASIGRDVESFSSILARQTERPEPRSERNPPRTRPEPAERRQVSERKERPEPESAAGKSRTDTAKNSVERGEQQTRERANATVDRRDEQPPRKEVSRPATVENGKPPASRGEEVKGEEVVDEEVSADAGLSTPLAVTTEEEMTPEALTTVLDISLVISDSSIESNLNDEVYGGEVLSASGELGGETLPMEGVAQSQVAAGPIVSLDLSEKTDVLDDEVPAESELPDLATINTQDEGNRAVVGAAVQDVNVDTAESGKPSDITQGEVAVAAVATAPQASALAEAGEFAEDDFKPTRPAHLEMKSFAANGAAANTAMAAEGESGASTGNNGDQSGKNALLMRGMENAALKQAALADRGAGAEKFGTLLSQQLEGIDARITQSPVDGRVSMSQLREVPGLRTYTTSLPTPMNNAQWGEDFSSKVSWLANQKIQFAEIHVNPADLGPIEIKIHMQNDQANIVMNSQHASVRDLLELNGHRLRDMMESSGVGLGQLDVSDQSAQQERQSKESGEHANVAGKQNDEEQGQVDADKLVTQSMRLGPVNLVDYYA